MRESCILNFNGKDRFSGDARPRPADCRRSGERPVRLLPVQLPPPRAWRALWSSPGAGVSYRGRHCWFGSPAPGTSWSLGPTVLLHAPDETRKDRSYPPFFLHVAKHMNKGWWQMDAFASYCGAMTGKRCQEGGGG